MARASGSAHGMYGLRGEKCPNFKRGRIYDRNGYVSVLVPRDHSLIEMATWKGGSSYIPEHRLIMAEKLGRALSRDELVHHIDGDHTNNAPDNLEVTDRSAHARHHDPERERVAGVFV